MPVRCLVAVLTAFALLLAMGAAPAAAATTWVVAPGATSTTTPCTTASPCSYLYALANAGSGDIVQFDSGEYGHHAYGAGRNHGHIGVYVAGTSARR